MTKQALQGIRVLDLTQVAAGPYGTMLLGYMGAEVIKVESCSRMDINRGSARPAEGLQPAYPGGDPGERPWNRAARHVQRNVNKLSVTLDLSTQRGKELLLGLAVVSDLLVENFRASVMDRLGLGYEAMRETNPQLIYVKMSSQGASGPEMDYGSLGSTLEQTGGLASVTGYDDGVPLMTNETYPDPVVGILSVGAAVAALFQRGRTGRGLFLDLSQREAAITLLGKSVLDYSMNGRVAGPMGNSHPAMAPHGCYPCAGDDAWVVISVGSDDEWAGLCRAMGRPDLTADPRFDTVIERHRSREALDQAIAGWTRERDHYQVMHILQAHGVPAGAVAKGSDIVADPHLNARGFWDTVDHPEGMVYKQVTAPWHLSEAPRQRTVPSAGLGEHNGYALGELLGLTDSELRELEEAGVIGTEPSDSA